MAVNNELLTNAQKAKRIERLFRDADVMIPVNFNGKIVQVSSYDISDSCRQSKMENLENFVKDMSPLEIIQNAGRINNVLYNRPTKADRERWQKMRQQSEE